MKLDANEALQRLAVQDHAILGTTHPMRGADAVPCVFAMDEEQYVGIPIDLVKPKSTMKLQRETNLEADPRATLMVHHWDADDWSKLWWVRAEMIWQGNDLHDRADSLAGLLECRYAQYAGRPFHRVIVYRIVNVIGWSGER